MCEHVFYIHSIHIAAVGMQSMLCIRNFYFLTMEIFLFYFFQNKILFHVASELLIFDKNASHQFRQNILIIMVLYSARKRKM